MSSPGAHGNNLIAVLAKYIYHKHDPALPRLAIQLLKRLATVRWESHFAPLLLPLWLIHRWNSFQVISSGSLMPVNWRQCGLKAVRQSTLKIMQRAFQFFNVIFCCFRRHSASHWEDSRVGCFLPSIAPPLDLFPPFRATLSSHTLKSSSWNFRSYWEDDPISVSIRNFQLCLLDLLFGY